MVALWIWWQGTSLWQCIDIVRRKQIFITFRNQMVASFGFCWTGRCRCRNSNFSPKWFFCHQRTWQNNQRNRGTRKVSVLGYFGLLIICRIIFVPIVLIKFYLQCKLIYFTYHAKKEYKQLFHFTTELKTPSFITIQYTLDIADPSSM